MIKAIVLLAALLISMISIGQTKVHKEEPSKNVEKPKKGFFESNQMYFENADLLASYFKKGAVVNGFPGYNHSISKQENIVLLEKWIAIKLNKDLLTDKGYESILKYTNKK